MKINRKTKTKFPAPGNKMSPLPDIGREASSSNLTFPSTPLEQNSHLTYQDSKRRASPVTRLRLQGGAAEKSGARRPQSLCHQFADFCAVAPSSPVFTLPTPHIGVITDGWFGRSQKTYFQSRAPFYCLGYVQVIRHTFYAIVGT